MMIVNWKCEECGANAEIRVDNVAAIPMGIQTSHASSSPRCSMARKAPSSASLTDAAQKAAGQK